MKTRLLLAATIAAALCFWTVDRPQASAKEFGIGSTAPALDIEHWIQDGNGFFKPVKTFDAGKVYVVEFWATWCGPCIASMPHLAELQNKYRGHGVQIISVSDETLDEVNDLLGSENEALGKTFAEITSAYSLTTDPDRSVYIDYMEAANQSGIPTSFIVGKSGIVEWIGHPIELEEPLEAVVNDSWDREAFKKQLEMQKQFEQDLEKMSMLAGAGRFDEAIKLIEERKEATKDTLLFEQWTSIGYQVKLSAGLIDEDVVAYFREQLQAMKGHSDSLEELARWLNGRAQAGIEIGPVAREVLAALKSEIETASPDMKLRLNDVFVRLSAETGDLTGAIAAQQASIDATSNERTKARLQLLLDELKQRAEDGEAATPKQDDQ